MCLALAVGAVVQYFAGVGADNMVGSWEEGNFVSAMIVVYTIVVVQFGGACRWLLVGLPPSRGDGGHMVHLGGPVPGVVMVDRGGTGGQELARRGGRQAGCDRRCGGVGNECRGGR